MRAKFLLRRDLRRAVVGLCGALGLLWLIAAAAGADEPPETPPRFAIDVMAVLSKAGCNQGTCHGNQNGKGGFRLSLRGQDTAADFLSLTREFGGRRVDRLRPEQSLLLLKPTGRVAHRGGVRFREDSAEYRVLLDWLAAGMPGPDAADPRLEQLAVSPAAAIVLAPQDRLQLQVTASFSDGSTRDVTNWAVYETSNLTAKVDRAGTAGMVVREQFGETTVLVRFLDRQLSVPLAFVPERPDFVWSAPPANNYIDELLFAQWQSRRINPSPRCDDATFVRRAFLDAIGTLPTADESRQFVADAAPDKRERLIERLLQRPEFADWWALKWSDVLRAEEKVLDDRGVTAFHGWIRESLAAGKPLDQFVRELLTGRGSTYTNPAANFYRANRDPLTRGETAARLFLGARLQCARCHNHPFDRWTQDDYYDWAAVFARIDYKIVENNRRDKLDKHEFQGEQIVEFTDAGEVPNPRTHRDASPRLLGRDSPLDPAAGPRLELLAEWLTGRDNEAFARSQANWIWYHVMGRGLVEPVDDFRVTNPAVVPPLLDALAADFVAGGFDLRQLVGTIMNSRAYQLSAEPNETNATDDVLFSRAVIRRLAAEPLLDAQSQVLDAPAKFNGYPLGTRAVQIAGVKRARDRGDQPSDGDRFLKTFGKPERLLACECERSNETTLTQVFNLLGNPELQQRIEQPGNRLDRLAQSELSNADAIRELFWTAFSRPPTDAELSATTAWLEQHGRSVGLQDVAWAVLNAKEFIFRK